VAQFTQVAASDAPVDFEDVPWGQLAQVVAAVLSWYRPLGQEVQMLAPVVAV
jgi:hypothetical protein